MIHTEPDLKWLHQKKSERLVFEDLTQLLIIASTHFLSWCTLES